MLSAERRKYMAVKLKEIAKETGLSISTVSRILNKDSTRKSSDETVSRVVASALRLGFFTASRAQMLYPDSTESERVYSIGCILTSEHETFVSPFFSSLLSGIQKEIAKLSTSMKYHFFVVNITDPGFNQFLQKNTLDCAIMLGRTSLDNIALLKNNIPNIVYAGINHIGDDMDEVICDAYNGASCAVDYLVSLGHTRIAFIGPTQKKHLVFNEHRYRGYLDTMKRHSLPVNDDLVVDTILTANDGYDSMIALIQKKAKCTAIFCGNDTVALGVMRALNENNISVPEDISIIGFDNIDTVAYIKPSLTTIDVPTKELGRLAVKVLLDKLETGRNYAVRLNIPFKLVIRESCKDIGGA